MSSPTAYENEKDAGLSNTNANGYASSSEEDLSFTDLVAKGSLF